MTVANPASPQTLEFKTELKQLLDLIIHSLYTKKEIFLRELVSNAADAIDKLRFESLQNPDLLQGASDWKIKIVADAAAHTLTVSDNGIGMSRDAIVENLGTIAKSGTRAFLDNLRNADAKERPELIGQFGVGFYASFMVADRVTVISRAAGAPADQSVRWESDGQGTYSVEPAEKPTRGTDVILHLRDDEDVKDFLSSWRLRDIVKRYSDFIEHPIVIDVEKEKDGTKTTEEETLNSRQAIWLRNKSQVTPEEYNTFYKQISRDGEDPLKTINIVAEGGATDFRALLFLPARRGMDVFSGPEKKSSVDLYVRRVLIQHECEQLVPPYLRFVRGVVDSADIPLNVSRETLQHNPLLSKIKNNVVNRVLKTLEELKESEYETYLKFYKEFGAYLKEGTGNDWSNKERLADLLLFESTKTEPGKYTTLAKYLEGMKSDQKEVHYLIGESRGLIEHSPYLEVFAERGEEVLLLTDPVDEYLVASLHVYKDKPLKAVDRGEAPTDQETKDKQKQQAEQSKSLLDAIKGKVPEVKEVRLSSRLKQSAACLVADDHGMSAHMERLFQRMGRSEEVPASQRILEINADHPAVAALRGLVEKDVNDPRVENYARLLYDQAVIAEGSRVQDPAAFARRINDLMAQAAGKV